MKIKIPFSRRQYWILHVCLKDIVCKVPPVTDSWDKRQRDTSSSWLSRPLRISRRRNGKVPLQYMLKDLELAFCNENHLRGWGSERGVREVRSRLEKVSLAAAPRAERQPKGKEELAPVFALA